MGGWEKSLLTWLSRIAAVTLIIAPPGSAPAADACGGEHNACATPLGTYHAALPGGPLAADKKRPAVLYFHGAGGNGLSVLGAHSYLRPFADAGYALLGANGLARPGNPFGPGWSFRPEGPQQRDELSFARQVLDDAAERFQIDRSRVLITGFSIGGSLTWYLACKDPGLGAAYAPLAGGFWRPLPSGCAGPVDLLHSHGWRDITVPLEGRPLRGGEIYQGDIFAGLQVWRAANGCKGVRPDAFSTDQVFWRRTWSRCDSGKELSLVLHASDHDEVPKEWAGMALAWFEARLKARGQ